MIYKEILDMVSDSAYNKFIHGLDYDGLKSTIVECATKIYIAQMELEKNYSRNMTNFMRVMKNFPAIGHN